MVFLRNSFRTCLMLTLCCAFSMLRGQSVRLIFDTDMGNDVDDAVALRKSVAIFRRASNGSDDVRVRGATAVSSSRSTVTLYSVCPVRSRT